MKRILIVSILGLLVSLQVNAQYDLTFTVDTGIRMSSSEIPEIGHDTVGNLYYLFYNLSLGGNMVATSTDGLTFGAGVLEGSNYQFDPRRVHLPNGQWRNYLYNQGLEQMESALSNDGVSFLNEPGVRYLPVGNDNNTLGVYDVYAMPDHSLTMIYIGDLSGLNNTRKAVSIDSGYTFTRIETNVLGDSGVVLPNPGNSYVDITTLSLGGSARRLICMRGGYGIYSFTSNDYGDSYNYDALLFTRDQVSSITGYSILGMYDPAIVLLDDGRYRIYFCANYLVGAVMTYSIFSATSAFPGAASVNDVQLSLLMVYPNPATETLYFTGPNVENCSAYMYDINGKVVMTNKSVQNNELNISGLLTGIYFLEVVNAKNGDRYRKKIIKY